MLLALAACGAPEQRAATAEFAAGDRMVYDSVAALAAASDLVVAGVMGNDPTIETLRAGRDDTYDVRFRTFAVTEVLAGPSVGTTITYADFPPDFECDLQVRAGDRMVLFLARQSKADDFGVTSHDEWYIAVGCDDGMLALSGTQVTALSSYVTTLERLDAAPATDVPPLVTTVAELAAVAQEHLGEDAAAS
jgi:hypothetical protein